MTIKRHILNLFQTIDDVALGFFTRIGPYITAAIPALLAGYGIYTQIQTLSENTWFPIVVGVAAGIGFEAAGIKIIHEAIEQSAEDRSLKNASFVLLVLASILFVGIVGSTIWFAEQAYPYFVRIVGAVSPLLAAMAYFAIGVERSRKNSKALDEAKQKIILENERERQRQLLDIEKRRLEAEANAEIERIKAKSEAEKHRLKALAQAEADRLRTKAQEEAKAAEYQRQKEEREAELQERLILMKQEQKHEKAMRKMDTTASTSTQGGSKKPFKRYDEFSAFYAETQDISEISRRMSLTPTTVRAYKRKFDAYNEELAALSSSENSEQNVIETLNGHI